ncbi:RRM domain-containing protein [Trichostrongylus colubriformis]|uniref:RRM domain-containing protein n=1 Tax=Trichostrongylus colubriformis TaxID=6319 RepID=A0AAN8IKC5_TRICO
MDERSTSQLPPADDSNTSAVPFGPVMGNEAKKSETTTKIDTETKHVGSPASTIIAEQYDDRRLYVSNIPFSFRSPDLIQMFTPFGVVSNAEIVMNERGSKGFGFVTLDTKEGCDAARAALNGTIIQGRVIEVKKATTAPYRRNSARSHHTTVPQPPRRTDFLPGQLPQIQSIPLITRSATDQLNALILAQNQLRLQSMVNPLAVRDSALLYSRQLPLQQQATLISGGVPLSPLTISPLPVQLLCAPPPQGIENLPPSNAFTATMMPLAAPGLAYASLPSFNNNILIPPAMPCRLPQDGKNEAFSNLVYDSGLFKPPPPAPQAGCIDLVGSLGLANGILPSFQPCANPIKDNFRASSLRAFDQSCVIDTSFHGEPLKEGQFGPIGRAVPPGGTNQVSSSNNDFRSQSSMKEEAYECNAGQSNGNNPNLLPVYHPFEPPTDRNGRKRLSSLDSYHLSKKQAKSI